MANHDHSHGSYYVPSHSWWPILSAVALFFLGLGSIDYFGADASGAHFLFGGLVLLVIVLACWFAAVIKESRAGLYDEQMHRTFRWGMIWFVFTNAMLFLTVLGALWYVRLFNITQLAGESRIITHLLLWPNFVAAWPQIQTPDPTQFIPAHQGLPFDFHNIITTIILLLSAASLYVANRAWRSHHYKLFNIKLIATIILGALFFGLMVSSLFIAATEYQLQPSSGIYASLLWIGSVVFLLNLAAGLIMGSVIVVRNWLGNTFEHNDFSLRAFTWFWNLLVIVWVAMFFSIY